MRTVRVAIGLTMLLGATLAPSGVCLAEPPLPSSASLIRTAGWEAGDPAAAAALLGRRTTELTGALRAYRESLERLQAINDQVLAKAIDKQRTWQELYDRGTISRRELEQGEAAVATARSKLDRTAREIAAADQAMAEAATAAPTPLSADQHGHTAALFREREHPAWSLQTIAPKLEQMFVARFGHALPISAFGQTPLHDRLGFDHRNALDVAVHPDSQEGQALIDYLQAQGIPYIAYRSAVPGAASGAHIHVGLPSPRISVVAQPGPKRP
jgi:hypothetical protein